MNIFRLMLVTLISCCTMNVCSQQAADEIKMISEYGSKNEDVSSILVFQNIDYYQSSFIGGSLKNKHFILLTKEMWDGELRRIDTIINTTAQGDRAKINSDTLRVSVIGSRVENDKLKITFRFPKFRITKKYDAVASDDYSLRSVGSDLKLMPNQAFPSYAYILPYEVGNMKMYCAVDRSGVNVEDWGKKFGIKHYLIFEMKFLQ